LDDAGSIRTIALSAAIEVIADDQISNGSVSVVRTSLATRSTKRPATRVSRLITSVAIACSVATCIAVTLFGLSKATWVHDESIPLRFATVTLIGIYVGSRSFGAPPLIVGAVFCGLLALASGAVWPLVVAVWFAVASTLLGRWVLRAFGAETETWTRDLLIGAGLYGTIVGLLAHFPVNYPGLYGLGLVLPFMLNRQLVAAWATAAQGCSLRTNGTQHGTTYWLDVLISVVAIVHFAVALMPEVGHDALAMHLFIPGHLAQRHAWGFDVTTYVWAVMPMLGDWLFSIGFMLGGETAARLINLGFVFVLGFLIRDLVIWARGTAVGARWAVLLFLSTPLTFTESSSLFIESVWASLVVAGSLSLFRLIAANGRQRGDWIASGFLFGSALACKAVTFAALAILVVPLALKIGDWFRRSSWLDMTLAATGFAALGAVPYATAWMATGNPVFPYFNAVFGSPFYPKENFSDSRFTNGISWDVIYDATFHTGTYMEALPGAAGFQWLLLLAPAILAAVAFRQRRAMLLFAVGGSTILLVFHFMAYLRYVFPSFAWIAAAIGAAASAGDPRSSTRWALAVLGASVVGLNLAHFESGTPFGALSLRTLTSSVTRETYLRTQLPIRTAVELLNRLNVDRTPVAVFALPMAAPLQSDALYANWYNDRFQNAVAQADSPRAIVELLTNKGADFLILDESWSSMDRRQMIRDASENVAKFGEISVRKVKRE